MAGKVTTGMANCTTQLALRPPVGPNDALQATYHVAEEEMRMAAFCPQCGSQRDWAMRFCANCGHYFGEAAADGAEVMKAAPAPRQVRKTVTILFCDVTGSTALGERLDPEALRAIMGRYFAIAKQILERHGGTVEKFIGDAVMAVFGIPALHEDDALRAVRAAAELRDALAALDRELDAEQGVVLSVRIGVDTGEVVAGDPSAGQTLVTGDAVNTAARLETSAKPAQILIGAATYRLVRDAVQAEPMKPLSLKGKGEPVAAYSLRDITPGAEAHTRRLDAPIVGRDRELARLRQAYEQAVADRAPQLFTVLGAAGVGKSRLIAEFLAGVQGEATILRGRCLPYGEGITYWPIGEIVRQAAEVSDRDSGDDAVAKIRRLASREREADVVASRVASAVGLDGETASQEELFWAIRKLLEALAADGSVAILFEDIHWAESTLLDLIEHVCDWSHDVPLLVLCAARQELLDVRPGWGGGKLNATTVFLEPLKSDAVVGLIEHLPDGSTLPLALRSKVIEAADGNPLFIEEMVAMLRDDARLHDESGWNAERIGSVSVPPSISALLAARLEQLGAADRAVAERASVVGRVFDRTAVADLSPEGERGTVNASLLSLVRKELLRPERSDLTDEDAFKFRHMLIRDAAYEGLPKLERANLHAGFAAWLIRTVGDRLPEYQEIVGYHLEQAYRYRTELGQHDELTHHIGDQAASHLGTAAYRALDRSDLPAAKSLLRRAIDVAGMSDTRRPEWAAELVRVHIQVGEMSSAEAVVDEMATMARGLPNPTTEAWHSLADAYTGVFTGDHSVSALEQQFEDAVRAFSTDGNDYGLAFAWFVRAWTHWSPMHVRDTIGALEKARTFARRAGLRFAELAVLAWLPKALAWGPTPASAALVELDSIEADARGDARIAAVVDASRALHLAMLGRSEDARLKHEGAIRGFAELGMVLDIAEWAQSGRFIAEWADDLPTAIGRLEESCRMLEQMQERSYYPTNAAMLARVKLKSGDLEAAQAWIHKASAAASTDDLASQVEIRGVSALIASSHGKLETAVRLAREAIELERSADMWVQVEAWHDLATVQRARGHVSDARDALQHARSFYVQKENVAAAAQLDREIANLTEVGPAPRARKKHPNKP
jgi:class 3 adenylate cyclase/tetratricopeptide (TPR) repeat protein